MKRITIGILAHVDAGKTTLSEGILYTAGSIRQLGRVDNQDAFLDNHHMERDRGITIFSKQAVFEWEDGVVTLLDTPGHVDFSAEMERTLQVLDYVVLVVSGADGVQSHTETLWQLFAYYNIPVFLFVNKMDMPGADKDALLRELQEKLSDACTDFGTDESVIYDAAALCEETLLDCFLETGIVEEGEICRLIGERKLFPCFFGSALRMQGVRELLDALWKYTQKPWYPAEFGARVYKITRDGQGNRLSHMKITGGTLSARQLLHGKYASGAEPASGEEERWSEKVNQIRMYSGERYSACQEVEAGTVCAVTGLSHTYPGAGLGLEEEEELPLLEPLLTYRMFLPEEWDVAKALPLLKQLEEEEPELHIVWDETLGELHVQIMGQVQIEILEQQLMERYQMPVTFGAGSIVYRETIAAPVIGVGHFEPLRHYAEIHLLLEPGEPGSGLVFDSRCSEDILDKNWQRLVLTHLQERKHRGVLTGSEITDIRISILAGRAHQKHTEGGDFRQATYRAVRQGLRQAESILLEPFYAFRLEVPMEMLGRAMTDMERMEGRLDAPDTKDGWAVLTGEAPVATIRQYQQDLSAYTGGRGKMSCTPCGYRPCHNQDETVEAIGYDADLDIAQTADSVFCAHGSGYIVPWDEVQEHMHMDSGVALDEEERLARLEREAQEAMNAAQKRRRGYTESYSMGEEEVHSILGRAVGANANRKKSWKRQSGKTIAASDSVSRTQKKKTEENYLLVDGYNIVFAWDELSALAKDNIDAARGKLMDTLCNYQAFMGCHLILVFDAYKVKGGIGTMTEYHNIHVVYTKEAETADQYIEKLAHQMGREYDVTVATSDGLEQLIIRGQGCHLMSARELREEIKRVDRAAEEFRMREE